MSVGRADFQVINEWKVEENGKKWNCCKEHKGLAKFIIDQTTGKRYLNESRLCVRIKCLMLLVGTPVIHPIMAICNIAFRILKLVTFSHFWAEKDGESTYNLQERRADAKKDILRTVATPFSIIALEFAALYGVFRPYDGRKIYASLEKIIYGDLFLAPCFQADPKSHRLGGDIDKKDAF